MNNRQEQIEQARRLIATGIREDLVAVLYQQFPELQESEEEMRKIVELKFFIAQCNGFNKENRKKAFDMIDALRPQPKKELTLLDENIINAAVAFVEQNYHFNYWHGIDKHTVIKALRSLKPYWKPSEEQMEALDNARFCKSYDRSELDSLYTELKKQYDRH